jgi:hypothetical protein
MELSLSQFGDDKTKDENYAQLTKLLRAIIKIKLTDWVETSGTTPTH